jgi:leucyl/phenylalanyl-tRNA--protein transferase
MIDPWLLVRAYRQGIFPMGLEGGDIGWFSPDPRGILPLDRFHLPARLARVMRQGKFEVTSNRDFAGVMQACREQRDEGTWINSEILDSYVALHRRGLAHSIETWKEGQLVGGLYGVHLRGAFFGESMFHRVKDASKVALAALVDRLVRNGFTLLDVQWVTDHLAQFGAIEVSKEEYLKLLGGALSKDCRWDVSGVEAFKPQ